jgi:hypothetical protein
VGSKEVLSVMSYVGKKSHRAMGQEKGIGILEI